jgi:release factor glutamine methyltransferase
MSMPTTQPLTVREALQLGANRLAHAGVGSARLDMSLLLAHALDTDRLGLYTDLDRTLSADQRARARELLARRIKREPIAYMLGRKEFFGLAFEVAPAVLIPRPETEHLVETAIVWLESQREMRPAPLLADIGVGSGAIAVAVAHRCPWTRWIATDLGEDVLAVARRNAERHGVAGRIEFRIGTLWEPLPERFDAVCSNPPYVAETDRPTLAPEVADWEPATALFGGPDGLDCLRTLVAGAAERLTPGGLLLLECGAGQAAAVSDALFATAAFDAIGAVDDLAGIPRVIRAQRNADAATERARVQIGILQSPLERGEREQNGDWLSFPPTASFPGSAATAEKIACPRFAADRIPICSQRAR